MDLIEATIGGPNIVAEPVDVFRNVFHRIVIASTDTYFDPSEPTHTPAENQQIPLMKESSNTLGHGKQWVTKVLSKSI